MMTQRNRDQDEEATVWPNQVLCLQHTWPGFNHQLALISSCECLYRFGTVGEAARMEGESDQINNKKTESKSTGESLLPGRLENGGQSTFQPESDAKDSQRGGSMLDNPRQNKR